MVSSRIRNTAGEEAEQYASGSMNKSTARILEVFSCFRDGQRSLRVSDLTRTLGMTKQMVIRALKTLLLQGYIVKDAEGRGYELGYRILELGNFDSAEPDLRQICAPYMQQIHALTRSLVLLAVPVGYHAIVIDGIDALSHHGFQLQRHRRGYPIPLNLGPMARAILAFLPDKEIQMFIEQGAPFANVSARYVADPDADALWAHIRLIRERGYDLGGGELIAGSFGMAFPIFDSTGYPIGAISLGMEEVHANPERQRALIPVLKQIMDNLNQQTRLLHSV